MEVNDEKLFPKSISEVEELEKYYNKDITNITEELGRWTNHSQFVHSKCYVVGNGLSRKNLDLERITRYHSNSKQKKSSFVIGCNYIYKDFQPDVIIAQDTKVLLQMVNDDVDIPVVAPLLKYNCADFLPSDEAISSTVGLSILLNTLVETVLVLNSKFFIFRYLFLKITPLAIKPISSICISGL